MSKSLGNLITVAEALERWSADTLRLFVLSSHYRSPLTYTEEGLEAAGRGVERLRLAARREGPDSSAAAMDSAPYRDRFVEAMDDDFNTAQAIAALFDLAREVNRVAEEGLPLAGGQALLVELAGVLGLSLEEAEVHLDAAPFAGLLAEVHAELCGADAELATEVFGPAESVAQRLSETSTEAIISLLVGARTRLRERRRFDIADNIRQNLSRLDIIVEDSDKGTTWRYRR
jgi:cysteinyl-tRNA synthetase